MEKSNIDFSELKYNLYKLLNVNNDSSEKRIKKAYKKLIIQFHPDKCSDLEEEIFYNITLAYQILSNKIQRLKYDNYLKNKDSQKTSYELKNNFNNMRNVVDEYVPNTRRDASIQYQNKIKNLEEKHGLYEDKTPVMKRYQNKKNNRSKLSIKQEDFRDHSDFNDSFKGRKKSGKFNDQIIKVDKNNKIVCYQETEIQNTYATVEDYERMYTEDTIQTNKFSSLDRAFLMHPEQDIPEEKKKGIKYNVNKYNNETKELRNMGFRVKNRK